MKTIKAQPKFTVGTTVRFKKPDLYGETTGKIIEIEKIFQSTHDDGTFDMSGLAHIERDISSIAIPYEFDGETLKIHYPSTNYGKGRTAKARFHRFAYTVESAKMRTLMPEKFITPIS